MSIETPGGVWWSTLGTKPPWRMAGSSRSNSARIASSPLGIVILSKWPMQQKRGCASRMLGRSTPAWRSSGRMPSTPTDSNHGTACVMSPSLSTMHVMPCSFSTGVMRR